MKKQFQSMVAKMPQNTGGGASRTKNRSVTVSLSSDTTTNREMTERRPREDRETFGLCSSLLGTLKYVACMLLVLFMGIGNMWGATETVKKSNNSWSGVSIDINHDECANSSSDQKKDGDADKVNYVKLRTNKNSNTLTLTVKPGYKVTGVSMRAYTNNKTATIALSGVSIGGVAISPFTPIAFPGSDAGTTASYNNSSIDVEAGQSIVFSFDNSNVDSGDNDNKNNQIMAALTVTYVALCTSPEIAWATEPADGEVGDGDFVASVTTTPTPYVVTWSSDKIDVATVTDGTIHYVAAGSAKITASLTYSGEDYCNTTVKVEKTIKVTEPLATHIPGVYEKAAGEGGYGQTLKVVEGRNYEVYHFASSGSSTNFVCAGTTSTTIGDAHCLLQFATTTVAQSGWISNAVHGRNSSYSNLSSSGTEFNEMGTSSSAYQMSYRDNGSLIIKVSGYDQFSIYGKNNGSGEGKQLVITIDGTAKTSTLSSAGVERFNIDEDEVHVIKVTGNGGSSNTLWGFSLRLPLCETEISTQPVDASLAVGDENPELSIAATHAGSYAWKESSDGVNYDGSSVLSSSATFTPDVNGSVQTKYYYCEITSDCDGTTVKKSNIVTVNVVGAIVNVTGVSLDNASQEFTLGATTTITLTATVAPVDATNKAISWASDKPLIVSVTDNGDGTAAIEGLAEGTATITVTTTDGSFTATCNVTVKPDPCSAWGLGTTYSETPSSGNSTTAGNLSITNIGGVSNTSAAVYDGSGSIKAFTPNSGSKYITGSLGGDALETVTVCISTANTSDGQNTASIVFSSAVTFDENKLLNYYGASYEEHIFAIGNTSQAKGTYTFTAPAGAKSFAIGRNFSFTETRGGAERASSLSGNRNLYYIAACPHICDGDDATKYSVSGTATICGGESADVTLANSQSGAKYVLLKDGEEVASSEKDGTGSALVWSVSAAGTYIVKAIEYGDFCETEMTGSAVITEGAKATISTAATTLFVGGATLTMELAEPAEGTWNSGTPATATISDAGVVSATAPGSTNITFTKTGVCPSDAVVITVEAARVVSFDVDGGTAIDPMSYVGVALTLPTAENGTKRFMGWFEDDEFNTPVTLVDGKYTPATSHTLYAQFVDKNNDATLSDLTLNGVTIEGFVADKTSYDIELPYKTASAPTVAAVAHDASAANVGTITQATLVAGEGTATFTVTAEDDTEVVYTIHFTVGAKDPVCIIKATPSSATEAPADGPYKGSAAIKSSGKKLSNKYDYVAVQLMEGKSFLATDKVVINQSANLGGTSDITKFYVFTEIPADEVTYVTVENATPVKGDNEFAMPAELEGKSSLYIGRIDASCNPTVGYLAVYRVMNPELVAISINGIAATKGIGNTFSVTLPAATNLASLTSEEVIAWNAAAATDAKQITTNGGAWAWGDNTYVLTDKDGDATSYTITLNKAAAIARVEISGTLSVMVDATTTLSAAVYDTNEALASLQDVTWSVKSGDEDYASVSTTGVVTGKAIGTAHIIATSVADPTISAQVDVAVSAFSGCKKVYWFGNAADAATNGVENNSTVFVGAPSSASSNSSKTVKLIADEWEVSVSKKTSSIGSFGTFKVPAGYSATLYVVTNTGGSRTFQLKQADDVKYTQSATSGDPVVTVFENVLPGDYTVLSTSNCSGFYMMAAELCRVPMTGVALDVTSKSMLTIDAPFQLIPAFAPADASDKRVIWSTDNAEAATVVDGLVTPVGVGTANITVRTEDGNFTDVCAVTVSAIDCASFEGVLYQMTAKEQASRKDISVSGGESNEVALTTADVVYTRGAAASLGVKGSNTKTPRITAKSGETLSSVDYNSADVYVKIPLGCALRATDVITFTANDDTKELKLGNTATSEGTINTTNLAYTVQSGDALEGKDVIYVWRGDNSGFVSVTITRVPLVEVTAVSLADLTLRAGKTNTPVLTITPSNGTILSTLWTIESESGVTGSMINATTGAVTAGTLDDTDVNGTITVMVKLNGDDALTATCAITVVSSIAQTNVDGSIVWDWTLTGATNNNQLDNNSDPKKNENFVLANVVTPNTNFASDKLVVEGEHLTREYNKTTPYFQGQLVSFNTTKVGAVSVTFSHTTNEITAEKPARELYINGVATGIITNSAAFQTTDLIPVEIGNVEITARNINSTVSDPKQYLRIAKIEFYERVDQRGAGWVRTGELGTICLKSDAFVTGANLYELQGLDEHGYLAFDQILSGELEKGKPYLFEATSNALINFYAPVGATTTGTPESTNGMVGTFVNKDFTPGNDAEGIYYFSGRHIWKVDDFTVSTITIPAYCCYVDMYELRNAPAPTPNPAPGRRRVVLGVQGTQVATGIEDVQGDNVQCTKVLINGQLFILRGEKMYNANGQLVK